MPQKIESKFWPELRDKFVKNWPEHCIGYNIVDNYIKWKKRDPNYADCVFHSLDGDWSDGTFAAVDMHQLFVYTLDASVFRLEKLLGSLSKDRSYMAYGVTNLHSRAVDHILNKFSLHFSNVCSACFVYWMPKETAAELTYDVPESLTLQPVKEADLEEVNALYALRGQNSLYLLKKLWKFNTHLGIYDSEGRLLSWVFQNQLGFMHSLQTQEFARRKGFGTTLAKAFAKEMAKQGKDCFLAVTIHNSHAINLFEKVGFKKTGEIIHLIEYGPKA